MRREREKEEGTGEGRGAESAASATEVAGERERVAGEIEASGDLDKTRLGRTVFSRASMGWKEAMKPRCGRKRALGAAMRPPCANRSVLCRPTSFEWREEAAWEARREAAAAVGKGEEGGGDERRCLVGTLDLSGF